MKGCLKFIIYASGIIALLVVALAILIGFFGSSLSEQDTGSSISQNSPEINTSATSLVPPTTTPEWMAPSFSEMCNNNDTMTDVQQAEYAKTMAGKKIVGWVGKVFDVESSNSSYKVQVDMKDGLFKSRQLKHENIANPSALLNLLWKNGNHVGNLTTVI